MKYEEEDEDVVIAGSELHEVLSKMGYLDYEVAPIPNAESSAVSDDQKFNPNFRSEGWVSQSLRGKVSRFCQTIIKKDSKVLRQRLTTISEARHLLDDHAEFIKNLLDEAVRTEVGSNKCLECLKYAAAAGVGYYCIVNQFSWWLTLPALTVARTEYTKWLSIRNLKKLVSMQTELHYRYKRALRILNHSFRMNAGANHMGSKFIDLDSEKLKFLQPITEHTLRSLETMSIIYYQTTLKMGKLLPDASRQQLNDQITYFDTESLTNCGEVTYDTLKQLFYRFILIQSEMLLALAILVSNEPDGFFEKLNRGMKIDYNVKKLVDITNEHMVSMRRLIDDFNKQKLPALEDKYRGFPGSKWQDLYVRVHLTSHKMRKAYDNVRDVVAEIENHLDKRTDETQLLETLKVKLNNACDDVDKAKDLAQLSALIVAKMARSHCTGNREGIDENIAANTSGCEILVVKDTDPEIIDEVFVEYIRERYSDVLLDKSGDDYLEGNYKFDKLLSKNLMNELKDALVDKKKDTKERESRALKRMNKNPQEKTPEILSSDSETEVQLSESKKKMNPESGSSENEPEMLGGELSYTQLPMPPPPPMPTEFHKLRRDSREIETDEAGQEDRNRRPRNFYSSSAFSPIKIPSFLSNEEETFIGSGENSDEEVVEDEEKEDDDESKL